MNPGKSYGTLNDGQQNDNDEEEESHVEDDSVVHEVLSVGVFDLVPDAASGSQSVVQMEDETLPHIGTLLLLHRHFTPSAILIG